MFKSSGWFEWCGNCVIPSAPSVLEGSGATINSIIANWSVLWGTTSYYLDVSADNTFATFVDGYNNFNVGNVTAYNISGLNSYSTYYYRVRGCNACGTGINSGTMACMTLFDCGINTVTDIDGNTYNTVSVGSQCWMKENLKTTKYPDGTSIPNVTNSSTWNGLTSGAYCDYNNNPVNSQTFGRLYNWWAVMNGEESSSSIPSGVQGICPDGWYLPSDPEWSALGTFLGGTSVAGGHIKETGTAHWSSPNTGADNSSGFTAFGSGGRSSIGFSDLYLYGGWWSSTAYNTGDGWRRYTAFNNAILTIDEYPKILGYSVRCLKN